ncbi:tight junction protein ZO-1-like isoform X1 [Leptotrombidium deliense]|uniref:Tight junction protein ZO-1-like isoform X1 n=1 Tax=Leptotrombidium deliense TaxID=299467 RepID=A0A443SWF8_9ACAR|nr:tight junction protein ZO-1-like isoform X1 [Leptotrombidium deliense]
MNLQGGEKIGWEYHNVTLTRVPGFGFGIAVSGGRDNPHFLNGDPSIAISDVLKAGPAEGKLNVNDRVVSANGLSLENVDYNTAVQVLRECGNSVNLLIKRRVLLPSSDLLKVTLTKSKRKDGCRLFIKEVTNKSLIEKGGNLQEGDIVTKINNTSTENLSLKEAKKLIDSSKEKLNLVIKREHNITHNHHVNEANIKENTVADGVSPTRAAWSNQNVYVQPPTRGDYMRQQDDKSNLTRLLQQQSPLNGQHGYGRNRGPIAEISLTQLDQPATPLLTNTSRNGCSNDNDEPPPRPPPPRPSTYGEEDPLARRRQVGPVPEPRVISFQKDGSVGIRLTGGNEVGIFVTAVQPGSPASLQGLQPGDKILKVNNMDMRGVTREEAVLYLLSIQDQIDLIVQYCKEMYDDIVANQKGDSFHIKTHFDYNATTKGELSFKSGEVFRVTDTLFNGVVGSWLVYRIGRNGQEIQKGVIPNKSRAEELCAEQHAEKSKKSDSLNGENRGSFFKRRSARRSKSLSKDNWEDIVFADGMSKFPAYERVTLKHPGFIRPVVLIGPLGDIAREKLLKDYPDKYASPQMDDQHMDVISKSQKSLGIVRLSSIKEIIEKGKHALLDVTPNAVERLNYAQFYPVVLFLRAENKSVVKELRARFSKSSKSSQKSSRKLFEQSVKIEKLWSHIFTSTLTLTSADTWYKKLRETIERQQQLNIWIAESKPEGIISDDFLFPMTSRLSYASSPESDLDLVNDSKVDDDDCSPRLVKASSDPSIATADDVPCGSFGNLPPYSNRSKQELTKALSPHSKSSLFSDKKEALDREEYFGSPKDVYNAVSPMERYGQMVNGLTDDNVYAGRSPATENGPQPPPRIDRANKPNKFRTARELLFGISEKRQSTAMNNNLPDYMNTTAAQIQTQQQAPQPASLAATTMNGNQKNGNIEGGGATIMNGTRSGGYMDNSSYSSDSYKYGSPTGTLDDRRYGSLTSANSASGTANRHDPYRFTRSTAQPVGLSANKSGGCDRNSKVLPQTPTQHSTFNGDINSRPAPPSPPPKPCNYPSMYELTNKLNNRQFDINVLFYIDRRLTDGRPVPPPKPMHYQPGRPQWQSDGLDSFSQATSNGAPYYSSKWSSVDMTAAPPAYFPKDQPPSTRAPGIPSHVDMQPSYANHQSVGSPSRRIPYSDTDSSSGYMTGKSSYDMRSQYSSKTSSSRSSSMMNGNGPYLNVPYPPRNRDSTSGVTMFTSSPSHAIQSPINVLDLSNRESRGSAFELYRKPGETGTFTSEGGTLTSPETGVSLVIPSGAIADDTQQEIYFKVCQDTNMLPPLDQEKGTLDKPLLSFLLFGIQNFVSIGETLLSPIVMCGPHGLNFEKPVELRLPHCASVNPESWSFALKSSDTTNGKPEEWQNVILGGGDGISASKIEQSFVSVLVDHF